jgi:AcrR family transcriptional regulator
MSAQSAGAQGDGAQDEGTPGSPPLPPGLDLLWGRRGRGQRGPKPGLSIDAIVAAAVRLADAEGLEAVSMARVAEQLGFTTMSLYRHVGSKEELLQLMWNASAQGAEDLVLTGDGWRARLRMWATIQREMMDRHPWITQMPMAAPPMAPNSLTFVERGLEAMDGSGLPDADKLRIIGLISSYALSEARMAHVRNRSRQPSPVSTRSSAPCALAFHISWSSSSLLPTCRYSDMVVNPSCSATRAMETASRPSASASRTAAATMASMDRPGFGPRWPRPRRPQSRSSPGGSGGEPGMPSPWTSSPWVPAP